MKCMANFHPYILFSYHILMFFEKNFVSSQNKH